MLQMMYDNNDESCSQLKQPAVFCFFVIPEASLCQPVEHEVAQMSITFVDRQADR